MLQKDENMHKMQIAMIEIKVFFFLNSHDFRKAWNISIVI